MRGGSGGPGFWLQVPARPFLHKGCGYNRITQEQPDQEEDDPDDRQDKTDDALLGREHGDCDADDRKDKADESEWGHGFCFLLGGTGCANYLHRNDMRTTIYTDGSHSPVTLEGGWAWVMPSTGDYGCGYEQETTNQVMELFAVHQVFSMYENFADPKFFNDLTIVTDSAYVANCWRDKWYVKWAMNGWRTARGPVKHPQLWKPVVDVWQQYPGMIMEHVRGHSGVPGNEMADQIAVNARVNKLNVMLTRDLIYKLDEGKE